MRQAHEVPIDLFNKLADTSEADGGPRRERRPVDGRSATVIDLGGVWISLEVNLRYPIASFRLWPREPERESGLVFAPEEVFTIRGGRENTGVWMHGRGEQYRTEVIVDYG